MTKLYPIACTCGALAGTLDNPSWVNRVICYCDDCQAFAEHLGRVDEILDTRGGSDIVQTAPRCVTFSRGREHLACLRLTPSGLLRWYASCCNTPIGNTPANRKLAFVGLVHPCLGDEAHLDAAFGPPNMRVYTRFAKGEPKPRQQTPLSAMVRLAWKLTWARISREYAASPFFDGSGQPVAAPVAAGAR